MEEPKMSSWADEVEDAEENGDLLSPSVSQPKLAPEPEAVLEAPSEHKPSPPHHHDSESSSWRASPAGPPANTIPPPPPPNWARHEGARNSHDGAPPLYHQSPRPRRVSGGGHDGPHGAPNGGNHAPHGATGVGHDVPHSVPNVGNHAAHGATGVGHDGPHGAPGDGHDIPHAMEERVRAICVEVSRHYYTEMHAMLATWLETFTDRITLSVTNSVGQLLLAQNGGSPNAALDVVLGMNLSSNMRQAMPPLPVMSPRTLDALVNTMSALDTREILPPPPGHTPQHNGSESYHSPARGMGTGGHTPSPHRTPAHGASAQPPASSDGNSDDGEAKSSRKVKASREGFTPYRPPVRQGGDRGDRGDRGEGRMPQGSPASHHPYNTTSNNSSHSNYPSSQPRGPSHPSSFLDR